MAKTSMLQAALSQNKKSKDQEAEVVPATPNGAAPRGTAARPEYRVGQANVSAYLPKGFQQSMRLLYAQTGRSQRVLLAEAMNDLFAKHNVPQVHMPADDEE